MGCSGFHRGRRSFRHLRLVAVCAIALAGTGCLQTVGKSTDQAELARIASGEGDIGDRREAMKYLTDQALLAKVARESGHAGIRKQAVGRLRDQELLTDIALTGRDKEVRRDAVRGLSDQNLLAKVVFGSDSYDVGKDALEKLTDQALLAKVVVESPNTSLQRFAFDRINAQDSLAAIASRSDDADYRHRALRKITDQNLLAQVAIGWNKDTLDLGALDRLTDVGLLRKVAADAKVFAVRREADKRLPDYADRQEAKRRITLAESIRNVRVEVSDKRVRKGGLALFSQPGNLRDQGRFLTRIPDRVIRPSGPNARFVTVTFAIDPSPTASFGQCDFFILRAGGKRQYSRYITAGGKTMQGFAGCDEKQMKRKVNKKTNVTLRFELPSRDIRTARLSLVGETRPIVGKSGK